jgi:hypothetical protein
MLLALRRNLYNFFVSGALGFWRDGKVRREQTALNTKAIFAPSRRALLYNLSSDPFEDVDVAAENPEVVKTMLARVEKMERHFPKNCGKLAFVLRPFSASYLHFQAP